MGIFSCTCDVYLFLCTTIFFWWNKDSYNPPVDWGHMHSERFTIIGLNNDDNSYQTLQSDKLNPLIRTCRVLAQFFPVRTWHDMYRLCMHSTPRIIHGAYNDLTATWPWLHNSIFNWCLRPPYKSLTNLWNVYISADQRARKRPKIKLW